MNLANLRKILYLVYLKSLGIQLHKLRRFMSRQLDRFILPRQLEWLLTITDKYTMVDRQRRKNLWYLAQELDRQNIKGDLVELGVCNGGTAGVLGYAASLSSQERLLWGYDSFEGLPEPTEKDGKAARKYSRGRMSGRLLPISRCVGSLEVVEDLCFKALSLKPEKVRLVKGWFQETLDQHPARPIALLHLDGDWYESIKLSLEKLYAQVTPGGIIVLDDYGYWPGAREALHDFFNEHGLENTPLLRCGYTQVYFRKV